MSIRTDLALEARDACNQKSIDGVSVVERKPCEGVFITRVKIFNENGEKAIGKKMGNYITVECPDLALRDEIAREKTAKAVAEELKALMTQKEREGTILVVGLGNKNVTADAIGPKVCDKVFVTRHMKQWVPEYIDERAGTISAIAPGVLGVTGLETMEVIRGIVENIKPSLVVAIDALAARQLSRISTTIQLSDAGIAPGSGIGNKRKEISKETLGVSVIAIGVPMVCFANTIAVDLIEQAVANTKMKFSKGQMDQVFSAIMQQSAGEMVVTPKESDVIVEYCAGVIADSMNLTFHRDMSLEEIRRFMN